MVKKSAEPQATPDCRLAATQILSSQPLNFTHSVPEAHGFSLACRVCQRRARANPSRSLGVGLAVASVSATPASATKQSWGHRLLFLSDQNRPAAPRETQSRNPDASQ